MSDNEVEDVSFLAGPGQGVTGKRAVYEPTGSQRCKQVVCSKTRAVGIVTIFVLIVLVIALIGSFARIVETPICVANGGSDGSDASNTNASSSDGHRQAISTNGSVFPWDHIRLPPGITPIAYHIFLHPNLTTFTFNGTTNITFRVTNDSEFVVVHIKNLKVNNVSVKQTQDPAIPKSDDSGFTGTNLHVVDTMECIEYEMLYIKVQPHFIGGAFYTLSINYFANVSRQLVGFYRSSYNMNGEKRWLLTTHFQPTDARGAFPCFDEPEMKANFTLSMVRDTDHISLFNMPLKTTTSYTDENNTPGLVRDDFETSVRMSTYLVAFVVCDFKVVSRNTTKGTLVSVYTPPDQISQADFALETATSVLEYFETFFGIDYPLPKQDLIAIPDFAAGAMENWGLITYRLTTILYDPQVSSASNQQHVAIVVAHELAHQWFGNLVTMKWWNDLWLNEGFASYMEYLGVHSVKPEWKMMDQFFVDTMQTALSLDSLTSSHPVSVKVDDPTEINEIFDSISYDKGAALIQMLEGFIGQTTLQEGLKDYLKEHMFGNAETHDLWMSLSKRLKKQPDGNVIDVSKVMSTWTDQMGYPVVTLTRKGSTIQADQQRFLLNPKAITDTSEAAYGYKWEIPLTYFTDYSSTPNIKWMRRGSVTFNVNSNLHWIKANVEQKGLYRVHYDDQNWRALIQQLHTNHSVFSAADRAGLIDDAFALSRSRHLNVSVALDLSNYLDKETEYVPWVTALSNLDYIGNLLEDKASYQYYSAYMKSKLQHMVEQLGWQDSGNILDKYLRAYTLSKAIKLNHEPSVNKAKQMFGNWMHSGTNVSANLKNVVYRAGIHYSCEDEWEFVWDKYTQTQVPSEKVKLMVALAATRDGSKLLRYLDMALDENKVRKGDTVSVVTNIASTAAGQILAWRKVKQHWDVYMKRYGRGSFDMTQLIQGITSGFATQFDYDEVQSFFNTHQSGSGYRTVSQTLEHIQMNSDYLAVNLNIVETWLKDKVEQLGLLPSDSNVS